MRALGGNRTRTVSLEGCRAAVEHHERLKPGTRLELVCADYETAVVARRPGRKLAAGIEPTVSPVPGECDAVTLRQRKYPHLESNQVPRLKRPVLIPTALEAQADDGSRTHDFHLGKVAL